MKMEDFKNKSVEKTNMTTRVTSKYRDTVTEYANKHDLTLAEFIRYAIAKVMEDEK